MNRHLRHLVSRAWTCYFRQAQGGILLSTPANSACNAIFATMDDQERDTLRDFFLSDDQIPGKFAERHGLSVSGLIETLDTAGQKLITTLFGFDA